MIVFSPQHVFTYKVPEFSGLSTGTNLSNAIPIWHQPRLGWVDDNIWFRISYMINETVYDPSSVQEVKLHYVCKEPIVGAEPFAITVTIPTDTDDKSTEPPVLKQKQTRIRNHGRASAGFSCRNGLHSDTAFLIDKLCILVTPLDDLVLEGGRGALRISVLYKELKVKWPLQTTETDMDEATGRVVIWGWDKDAYETKIFVGDLV